MHKIKSIACVRCEHRTSWNSLFFFITNIIAFVGLVEWDFFLLLLIFRLFSSFAFVINRFRWTFFFVLFRCRNKNFIGNLVDANRPEILHCEANENMFQTAKMRGKQKQKTTNEMHFLFNTFSFLVSWVEQKFHVAATTNVRSNENFEKENSTRKS